MKSNLNIFFFNLSSIFFLCSCHTLEHQNIFVHGIKKNQDQKIITTENEKTKNKKVDKKKISNKEEMAPIKIPKKVQKVKTVALNKKINLPKMEKFTLSVFKGWSEDKLIAKMGKSDFVKQEGQLKNHQYHFSKCFLDIFLTKKGNFYLVNYIQTRSTRLYGRVETKKCMKEINSKLKK